MNVHMPPPRFCIETVHLPQARPAEEVRKPLLRLRPASAAFETGQGFQTVDGDETTFMLGLLFELKLIDGAWRSYGAGPFARDETAAARIMEDQAQSITERLRRVSQMLALPQGYPLFTFMGYSAARLFEDLPGTRAEQGTPELVLRVYSHVVRYRTGQPGAEVSVLKTSPRQVASSADILSTLTNPGPNTLGEIDWTGTELTELTDQSRFLESVDRAKEHIVAGDIYQVQLSRRARSNADVAPLTLYDRLTQINPAPYMFYVDLGGQHLISASPELMVRCQNGLAQVRPIAGTMPKGQSGANPLGAIPKEASEHLMLVDLARNDLARCATAGTVKVPHFMQEAPYGALMHLVSTVEADADPSFDIWDIIAANFPAGTMTGAPKIRAMEIIADLEEVPRGAFSGCVGYVTGRGSAVLALNIRTIVGNPGRYYLQAGAGVVADSSAVAEWQECGAKIQSFARIMEPSV